MAEGRVETIIVQRLIPHYRIKLFHRLHQTLGIKVVTSATPPGGSFLSTADPRELDFAIAFPFHFSSNDDMFRAVVPVAQILETLRPDRVIAEFGLRMSSSYSLPLYRRCRHFRRLAFWTHGWQMERGFERLTDRAVQFGRLPLYAAADAIATYTEEGATWIRGQLPRTPVIALGNALDNEAMASAAAQSIPKTFGSPQLLAVGRLTRDKRFETLIDVIRLLKPRLPGVTLTLIGDGPEHDRLAQHAGPLLGKAVHMLGAVHTEAELAPHFLGADLLIVPGAAGLSVNHALAYHLPVVAFARQPGGPLHHPEITYVQPDRSGLLVRPATIEALANAIASALADGSSTRLRAALRERPIAPTIEDVVGQFERLVTEHLA